MKPYASYKPSGVPWLGDVPAHWEVKQARFVMTCNDDVLPENTSPEQVLDYIEISDVDEVSGVKGFESVKFSEAPSRARRLVMDGDVIVSTVRTYLRAVAAISNPTAETVVSTGFAVLRPRVIDSRYSKYAILYDGFISEVISRSKGISYPAINATDLVRISVPLPPPDEQQAIAEYLDVETARIDTLIHEKDELVGLLKEWRQSVIAEVVTKGLDKTVPMKPAGVPWLGDVPAHWKVKKLKHLVKALVGGATPTTSEPALWDDVNGTPWVAIGDMSNRYSVMATNRKVSSEGILEKRMQILRAGTVIYSMYASVGYASILGVDAVTNQAILGLITTDKLNNKFFMNYLNSIRESVLQEASSNTQDNINAEKVRRIPLLCPPLEEQQAIADYLDTETAKIDALIEHAKDDIVLLKELRAATIADAVLGRIDVRTPSLHV